MSSIFRSIALGTTACLAVTTLSRAQFESPAASTLENQPLTEAVTQLTADLRHSPDDDATRFALGMAQSLRAAERMAGTLYKFGLHDKGLGDELPFLRLPVPKNPDPQAVSAEDLDAMFAQFVTDLAEADKTLEAIHDPNVKLPVHVGLIHVDLNGDAPGGIAPAWRVMHGLDRTQGVGVDVQVDPQAATQPADAQPADDDLRVARQSAESFAIAFDAGDVKWLRGYVHLLSAMAEIVQAYDKKEIVERTGQLFFDKVKSPHAAILSGKKVYGLNDDVDIADAIAFVHLLNLPVRDAAHMKAAREHLLTTLKLSRESWAAIRAETDDDREWIPNEKQQNAAFAGAKMTPEIVDGWLGFLDDCEACLNGEKLLPFWRGTDDQGINLRKVFDEPQTFDLVLWVQGTGVTTYIETGKPVVKPDRVEALDRLLGGDFMSFAFWVN